MLFARYFLSLHVSDESKQLPPLDQIDFGVEVKLEGQKM